MVEIVRRARDHGARLAVDEGPAGRRASYAELVALADDLAGRMVAAAGGPLDGARVAYLVPSGVDSVATLWGIWLAGGVGVPLALSHPEPELAYTVSDSGARLVVATRDLAARVRGLAAEGDADLLVLDDERPADPAAHRPADPAAGRPAADAINRPADPAAAGTPVVLPDVPASAAALIIYTSGSTGRPKGAVWTHAALAHQVTMLVEAWEWSADDRALLLLPLHHVHGLVNVVTCALWSGATVRVMRDFDARTVLESFGTEGISVLMAVPTIWYKLVDAYGRGDEQWRSDVAAGAGGARLMVSGSAALPVSVLERWRDISGHVLLERYGMTEIGMALSNPYHGPRVPGSVGVPLPGVEVRVVADDFTDVTTEPADGQLLVRGAGMFREYWQRPEATREAFHDGWFITGDAVTREDGRFRIRGRMNVDIIKTGGYKISALEIEEALRRHPAVGDCAVVGLPNEEWGQTVAAALVPGASDSAEALDADTLTDWLRTQLAPYKVPRRVAIVDDLPRNAMGKVVKPRVVSELFEL